MLMQNTDSQNTVPNERGIWTILAATLLVVAVIKFFPTPTRNETLDAYSFVVTVLWLIFLSSASVSILRMCEKVDPRTIKGSLRLGASVAFFIGTAVAVVLSIDAPIFFAMIVQAAIFFVCAAVLCADALLEPRPPFTE